MAHSEIGNLTTLGTTGFHHVTLVSGHAPRTVRFYRDILGFLLLPDPAPAAGAAGPRFGLREGTPEPVVEFLERPGEARGRPGIGGVHHVAFGTADENSLLMWKRWLTQHGIRTNGPINRGYFRSLYFGDPDGQILELATAGPGYAIDEPEERLGREVILHHEHLLQQTGDGTPYGERTHPEPVDEITRSMAISGIHHVSAITSDTERADRFYAGTLGLTRVKKTVNQDDLRMPHHFWARYDGRRVTPHSSWTLFEYPARFHRLIDGVGQTASVGFRAGPADLGTWRSALLEAGVPVSEDREDRLSFVDPDGIALELVASG